MHVLETRAKAPGKVNLYLAVGNPREDGYHPLATLFSSVNPWSISSTVPENLI